MCCRQTVKAGIAPSLPFRITMSMKRMEQLPDSYNKLLLFRDTALAILSEKKVAIGFQFLLS